MNNSDGNCTVADCFSCRRPKKRLPEFDFQPSCGKRQHVADNWHPRKEKGCRSPTAHAFDGGRIGQAIWNKSSDAPGRHASQRVAGACRGHEHDRARTFGR